MKSISLILEYTGPTHTLRRWSQELMAYDFKPVYRPAYTMKDVDTMNRGHYHQIMYSYNAMTLSIRERDCVENPAAYCQKTFETLLAKGIYSVKNENKTRLNRQSDVAIAMMLLNSIKSCEASNAQPCVTRNVKSWVPINAKSCITSNAKSCVTSNAKSCLTRNGKACTLINAESCAAINIKFGDTGKRKLCAKDINTMTA